LVGGISAHERQQGSRAIQLTTPHKRIDLILHTLGGLVLVAGMSAKKAKALAAQFASGTWTHD